MNTPKKSEKTVKRRSRRKCKENLKDFAQETFYKDSTHKFFLIITRYWSFDDITTLIFI